MATITFTSFLASNPGLEDVLDSTGTIGTHNATTFQVINNNGGATNGFVFTFTGTGFTYSGTTPTAGTITGVTVFDNASHTRATITGTFGNNSLVTIRNTLQSSGTIAALNALLSGADTYNGSTSADKLRSFGASGDQLNGGAGIDFAFIDRSSQTRSLTLDIGDPTIVSQIGEGSSVIGIERVEFRGGFGNDNLTGGALADILIGNAGRDWLAGGGGADNLQGGDGPDTLTGDAGTDILVGGTGIDILDGGSDGDNLDGGANSDWVDGGIGSDTIVGSAGADNLDGNDGTDTVTYAASTAAVTVNLALGTGSGGHAHNDVLSGIENVTGSSFADTLAGDEVNNILNGGLGIDTVVYSSATQAVTVNLALVNNQATGAEIGIDQLLSIENVTGGGGSDAITGNVVANTLRGNGGDDVLDGGSGVDTLVGGLGNDRYHLDVAGDQVIEGAGGGNQDRIRASFSYVMPAGLDIEFLETTNSAGTAPIDLTGNELQNRIEGNAGSNFLIGAGAFTTVIGDTMVGLGGNDTYFVRTTDRVTEAIGGGSDTVIAQQSYDLAAGVEVERLMLEAAGTGDLSLTGNEFDNIIDGNAGDNRLNGGFGRDTMSGFAGNDTYVVDRSNDIVNEAANAGNDRVETTVTYGLSAGVHVEVLATTNAAGTTAINLAGNELANTLEGNRAANTLLGNGGNDRLDGREGNDVMTGGAGDDTYIVEFFGGERTNEVAGGGTDTVIVTVADGFAYTLTAGSHIERLVTNNPDAGGSVDLTGNELANRIEGSFGGNVINGAGGADVMIGFDSADTYFVDHASDVVIDSGSLDGDLDEVLVSVSWTLTAGSRVAVLRTTDSTSTAPINLTGNAVGNNGQMIGNAGNNILDSGGGGGDEMRGLGGNDTYRVSSNNDSVVESAGGGTDTVLASVSYDLISGEVEFLATSNSAGTAAINLVGSSFANTITGNAGANVLNGLGGNDTVRGLGGSDTFFFSTALNAATNVDRLLDYNVAADSIRLENAVFTTLPAGTLAAGAFRMGAAAADADDRIIYNSSTGALIYDSNGNAAGGATQFAILPTALAMANTEFVVV